MNKRGGRKLNEMTRTSNSYVPLAACANFYFVCFFVSLVLKDLWSFYCSEYL